MSQHTKEIASEFRWVNVKILGGTTAELREAADQLIKRAEKDSAIFSGEDCKEIPISLLSKRP